MHEVVGALESLRNLAWAAGDDVSDVLPVLPLAQATLAADSATVLGSARTVASELASFSLGMPTSSDVSRVVDLTIVMAEPSRAQSSIVRGYLHELGIEKIHVARSGREALELANRECASVVLSAMHLSDMTGVELARGLRADPGCAGVGFVLASSESDGGDAGVAAALETADAVLLPKPFDLRRLAQTLALATGRAPDEILGAR
jgi:CheY-like chemotaxis protein